MAHVRRVCTALEPTSRSCADQNSWFWPGVRFPDAPANSCAKRIASSAPSECLRSVDPDVNFNSLLRSSHHAIRACETWAQELADHLAINWNATYFLDNGNHDENTKPVKSRTFIAIHPPFRPPFRRDCSQVNRPLLALCTQRLAASQHRNFRTAPLSSIFISTMRPGQGLNRTTGDYQCCSRSSA
jgi:hypothetical protein